MLNFVLVVKKKLVDKTFKKMDPKNMDPKQRLVNLKNELEKAHRNFDNDRGYRELRSELENLSELQVHEKGRFTYSDQDQLFKETDGATVLHSAVTLMTFTTKDKNQRIIIDLLIEIFPSLITESRVESKKFTGQTPLHMAVCKGNTWLVETMLDRLDDKKIPKHGLWSARATGITFLNTAMMGEIPLTIAALTKNEGTFFSI